MPATENPDAVEGGTWEAFERIMQGGGYFKQGLSKVEVAEEIGSRVDPEQNRSPSFRVLWDAIMEAAA